MDFYTDYFGTVKKLQKNVAKEIRDAVSACSKVVRNNETSLNTILYSDCICCHTRHRTASPGMALNQEWRKFPCLHIIPSSWRVAIVTFQSVSLQGRLTPLRGPQSGTRHLRLVPFSLNARERLITDVQRIDS